MYLKRLCLLHLFCKQVQPLDVIEKLSISEVTGSGSILKASKSSSEKWMLKESYEFGLAWPGDLVDYLFGIELLSLSLFYSMANTFENVDKVIEI